jgi:hypothetical protein
MARPKQTYKTEETATASNNSLLKHFFKRQKKGRPKKAYGDTPVVTRKKKPGPVPYSKKPPPKPAPSQRYAASLLWNIKPVMIRMLSEKIQHNPESIVVPPVAAAPGAAHAAALATNQRPNGVSDAAVAAAAISAIPPAE